MTRRWRTDKPGLVSVSGLVVLCLIWCGFFPLFTEPFPDETGVRKANYQTGINRALGCFSLAPGLGLVNEMRRTTTMLVALAMWLAVVVVVPTASADGGCAGGGAGVY